MGIGNPTNASACASAILEIDPIDLTGAGTGLDDEKIMRKAKLIKQAIEKHRAGLKSPIAVLQCLQGFEIRTLAEDNLFYTQQTHLLLSMELLQL